MFDLCVRAYRSVSPRQRNGSLSSGHYSGRHHHHASYDRKSSMNGMGDRKPSLQRNTSHSASSLRRTGSRNSNTASSNNNGASSSTLNGGMRGTKDRASSFSYSSPGGDAQVGSPMLRPGNLNAADVPSFIIFDCTGAYAKSFHMLRTANIAFHNTLYFVQYYQAVPFECC